MKPRGSVIYPTGIVLQFTTEVNRVSVVITHKSLES